MILAIVCAATAAALWLRPRPSAAPARLRRSPRLVAWAGLVLVPAGAAVLVPGLSIALGVVVALAALGAGFLWRRQSRRVTAARESARIQEACAQLAAELAAGQPPGVALQRIAADWPMLAPAAEAFALGADVSTVLRDTSGRPGAGDLRLLAAGWQVSHRTGAGLAGAVERIAESLREEQTTRRLVNGELASARATARLVAGLPVLALAMGSGAGGAPWRFLLTTPVGLVCLAAGLALALAGLWWIEVLTADTG